MKTSTKIIIIFLILLAIASGVYWYIFFYGPGNKVPAEPINTGTTGGFVPLTSPVIIPTTSPSPISTSTASTTSVATSTNPTVKEVIPALRLITNGPIGGYGASTTASSSVVRWIDRGRGNIMEAKSNSKEITTLSNTLLPKMYESVWNKNATAFIGSIWSNDTDDMLVVYAKLNQQTIDPKKVSVSTTTASSTASASSSQENVTPYYLRGKNMPENILCYAVSPKGDKIVMFVKESDQAVGYISNFDGTSLTKIYSTPLTAINIEWPEDNTIAITTKSSANHNGYLYFLNPKTGVLKKILGPISGLSTKVSRDAKYVFFSKTGADQMPVTGIQMVNSATSTETMLTTLADKCVWAHINKENIYCGTPSTRNSGTYPDDWYKGTISFSDKIWKINAKTGDINLITPIIDQSDRVIDTYNLELDPKDEYLYFMNKTDLSLWSYFLRVN